MRWKNNQPGNDAEDGDYLLACFNPSGKQFFLRHIRLDEASDWFDPDGTLFVINPNIAIYKHAKIEQPHP